MIKNLGNRTIRITLFALIFGVLAPIAATTSANASGTITETVHVKDHTGASLAGALVEFGYGPNSIFTSFTSPATVPSGSDQVTITMPSDYVASDKLGMWIEPPAGDTADAVTTARSTGVKTSNGNTAGVYLDPTQSEVVNVQLLPSSVVLNPVDSANNPLPLPLWVDTPIRWTSGVNSGLVTPTTNVLLRTGAFGINIASGITQSELDALNNGNSSYDISLYPNGLLTYTAHDTSVAISLFGVTLGSPDTLTQYDPSTNQALSVQPQHSQGIYQSNNLINNFKINTLDPRNSQPLATSNDNGYANVFKEDSNGNQNDWVGTFNIDDAGNSGFYLAPGTYLVQIAGPNASGSQVPTFSNTNYSLTVTSQSVALVKGNFGDNGAAVSAGSNGFFPTTYTVANFVGKIEDSSGAEFNLSGNQSFCEHLQQQDNQGNWNDIWSTQTCPQLSVYGMTIPGAGTWRVAIQPNGVSGYTTSFTGNVVATQSGGSLNLAYAGGATTSPVNHDIRMDVPNLFLNIIDPSSSTPNTPLTNGGGNINLVDNGQQSQFLNFGIDPNNPGETAKLPDGTYYLYISPDQSNTQLAPNTYTVVVSSGAISMYEGQGTTGSPVLPNSNHVFTVSPSLGNVSGTFLVNGNPPPNTNTQNVSACDQYLVNGNWQVGTCTGVSGTNGAFALSVNINGTHRLIFQPNGVNGIANTYSDQFVVSGNGSSITHANASAATLNLGTIAAAQPTLSVQITAGGQVQQNAGVEVRQDNQWIEWDNTGSSGTTGISFAAAGTYQFIVHPAVSGAYTTKTYTVVVTGTPGSLTASITGVTPTGSTYVLPLAAATLSGLVEQPNGAKVWNAQVMATDLATNQDIWQNSVQTFSDGSWSMSLPAGTYNIRAIAPYGVTQFSDSQELGIVTVDSSGNATLSGDLHSGDFANATPTQITLKLQHPYWSGTVKDPGINGAAPTPDANASVCLNLQNSGYCANTDLSGNWSMSKPLGFTDFDANSSLQARPNGTSQFAETIFNGKSAIVGSGFATGGGSGINITLQQPNFVVSLNDAGNIAASNLWVNVSPINGGPQIAGGLTGSDGKVNLFVDPSYLSNGVNIYVDVTGNSSISNVYGQTNKTMSSAALTADTDGNGLVTVPVTLIAPNIRGQLNYANGTSAGNTNVDLFNATTQQWVTNGFVSPTGSFTLNAPGTGAPITYTLTVRAPNNSSIPAAGHSYLVTVDGTGNISSITDPLQGNSALTATNSIYTFSLVAPSVTGVITNKSGSMTIQNSWVQPTGPGQEGSNSDSNGKFALALPDGTWQIQANVPYGDSSNAPSAVCTLTVSGGATTAAAGTGCAFNNGSITLTLQEPNLAVTLLDSSGHPIVGGNVSADAQSWHSNSQTDASGTAHIYVDWDAIKSSNGITSGPVDFHLGLHPAFGSTTSINLDCDSMGNLIAGCPAIQSLNGAFTNTQWTVTLPSPNTHFTVLETTTGTVAEPNGWAQLLLLNNGYISGNVGSSNTDANGQAVFNVTNPSDTSVKYAVQVNPSWSDTTYAPTLYTNSGAGFTYSQINGAIFTLGSPNLTVTSKAKNGTSANLGGWVCAEYFNGNTGYTTSWITCQGLNQNGAAKMLLPWTTGTQDQQYIRLTFNSGDASFGATNSCTVVVTNGVVQGSGMQGTSCSVSGGSINENLSAGNVQGRIIRQDTSAAVVGAIVKATVHGLTGAAAEASAIMTSTDINGNFGLQLDPSEPWDLKVIPVHITGLHDLETMTVESNTATSTGNGVQPPQNGQQPFVFAQPFVLVLKP